MTRLPRLHLARRVFRVLLYAVFHVIVRAFTKPVVRGRENIPRHGPALMVINHLGDADFPIAVVFMPRIPTALAAMEQYDENPLGRMIDRFGVIWVHRGQPDRRAIQAALKGLEEGRMIAIAPEGRESLTSALEEGTDGAAYLAWKAGVPILPVAVTGTMNDIVYPNMRRLKRTPVTVTSGPVFRLPETADRHEALRVGTPMIMNAVARLLPPEYRGVHRDSVAENPAD